MAKVFIPKEMHPEEPRVAATPETVAKLEQAGLAVIVQMGAGESAYIPDAAYQEAGAELVADGSQPWAEADLVLKVREPVATGSGHEADRCRAGAVVVAMFVPQQQQGTIRRLVERRVTCFSMNLVPRITRAQKMDSLSSQSNIAGYKAALLAASTLPKFFPLLMTAAGTVKPAKVVVMGAGVAGLQAIATARRIGAQVWATDVRLSAKEQVESLGAKFIDVPGMEDMEDAAGYAKQATPEFLARQREVVAQHVADADAVITTALVPGKPAPKLISTDLVGRMRPGSVIVDLAAEQGGNCERTVAGQNVVHNGVTIIGQKNLPGTVPRHASELYARNVLAFVETMIKDGAVQIDLEDEVLSASVVTHDGQIRHAATAEALAHKGGT